MVELKKSTSWANHSSRVNKTTGTVYVASLEVEDEGNPFKSPEQDKFPRISLSQIPPQVNRGFKLSQMKLICLLVNSQLPSSLLFSYKSVLITAQEVNPPTKESSSFSSVML